MRYTAGLAETHDLDICAVPSPPPPTEAELAAWNALSRDEQLARYREALVHPDCNRVSNATITDVLAAARRKVAARLG